MIMTYLGFMIITNECFCENYRCKINLIEKAVKEVNKI